MKYQRETFQKILNSYILILFLQIFHILFNNHSRYAFIRQTVNVLLLSNIEYRAKTLHGLYSKSTFIKLPTTDSQISKTHIVISKQCQY